MINSFLENPLFKICSLVGLIFIVAGFVMFHFPPKKINFLYGYRTISSMKNQERWNFAQKFSAKEMMKLGTFLTLISLLAFITNFDNSINLVIALSLTLTGIAILFINVEKAIKAKFNN